MCVHVDDGIWAGEGPEFHEAQRKLRKLINVKVEKTEVLKFWDDESYKLQKAFGWINGITSRS